MIANYCRNSFRNCYSTQAGVFLKRFITDLRDKVLHMLDVFLVLSVRRDKDFFHNSVGNRQYGSVA